MTALTRAQRRLLAEVVRAGILGVSVTGANFHHARELCAFGLAYQAGTRLMLSTAMHTLHASGLLNLEAIDGE